MIALIYIHHTNQFMPGHKIYQLINPREKITIFWACFIEVSEANTYPPLVFGFRDQHHIGKSGRELNFPIMPRF